MPTYVWRMNGIKRMQYDEGNTIKITEETII